MCWSNSSCNFLYSFWIIRNIIISLVLVLHPFFWDLTISAKLSSGFDGFGEILTPQSSAMNRNAAAGPVPQPKKQDKVITGDLDSSLASLAGNLNINSGKNQLKKWVQLLHCIASSTSLSFQTSSAFLACRQDHQWTTAGPEKKGLTGGNQWQQPGVTGSTFGQTSMVGGPKHSYSLHEFSPEWPPMSALWMGNLSCCVPVVGVFAECSPRLHGVVPKQATGVPGQPAALWP